MEKEIDELKLNYNLALEFREKAEYKLAIESLYKALDVEPDNFEVLVQLAEIYALMNDYERSIQYYREILELDENNLAIVNALFNKYFIVGKFKDALDYAQRALSIEKNDKNFAQLISVLDKFSDIKALRELLENEQHFSQENLILIAKVFVRHAFANDALKCLEKVIDCEEKTAVLAQINFNNGQLDVAKELVMSLSLDNPDVWNLKGLFFIEEMNFTNAIKCFSKAILRESSEPKYYYNLGNAYFYNGWTQEAVEAYKKAVELDVTNVDYRFALANLYYEMGEYKKARGEVSNILHIDDEHLDTKVLVALLKYSEKDYLGAKQDLENALKLSPNSSYIKTSLARVLIDLKLFEKAESLISEVLEHNKDVKTRCVLAYLYDAQKKYTDALALVDEVLEEVPCYMYAFYIGMRSAFSLENLDLVQKYAQDALSIDINFASAYYYLGLVRKKQYDYEEAIECFKRAIMYDLNNAEYYAEMAKIYAEQEEIKSAIDYANEAIAIDGTSTEYLQLYSDLAKRNRKICHEK